MHVHVAAGTCVCESVLKPSIFVLHVWCMYKNYLCECKLSSICIIEYHYVLHTCCVYTFASLQKNVWGICQYLK